MKPVFLTEKLLSLQWFENDEELNNSFTNWFKTMVMDLYDNGLKKLLKCYENCVEDSGDYVEK